MEQAGQPCPDIDFATIVLTFAEFQSLTSIRDTGPERAEELTLFHSPLTGLTRIVIRPLLRKASGTWEIDLAERPRVVEPVGPEEVARLFGVDLEEARRLLALAERDGRGEQAVSAPLGAANIDEAEARRESAERTRESAERTRADAEGSRAEAEGSRVDAESARQAAEDMRLGAEELRLGAEQLRRAAEQSRMATEQARRASEVLRRLNEQSREAAEQMRSATEEARQAAREFRHEITRASDTGEA